MEYISGKIKEVAAILESQYSHKPEIDFTIIESMRNQVKAFVEQPLEKGRSGIETGIAWESIPDELRDSAEKIIKYSEIPRDRAEQFRTNLEVFRKLRDKLSTDAEARNIRSSITSIFFEIYEAVYKRVKEENNTSRLFQMFLTYSFMDEKLLSPESTLTLYRLAAKAYDTGHIPVYNMAEWLNKIYSMEKDPSISEFGQDYFDIFREMKKRREITEKDKSAYDNNINARLNYEITNMFKTNHRICHGQISVYFPILNDSMISRDLSKALVTPQMVNDSIKRILEVDFSAFHREVSYRNSEKAIEKEFIMKQVLPDIILMPVYGSRAIMWQELTGRDRNTPGRFILPIFTGENLDDMIVRLIGIFRWELCRTVMGVAWNDITVKSLTSEYTDYIQFYKKNRDLTEEGREKIKTQIQKYRGMLRDIFSSDYETWVNCEAKGNVRLNKVVRGILYRHCSFSRNIREQLEKQPMYSDIAIQFNNLRNKQARELESHYNKLIKAGTALEPELEENLRFYKEM